MAMCFTLACGLANSTVNHPGKQNKVYFKHNKHKHTENGNWRDGRLALAWKNPGCQIIHIIKQQTNSKKCNKTCEFSTENSGTIFEQGNRKIQDLILLVGESVMNRCGDAGRRILIMTSNRWFSSKSWQDHQQEELPDGATLDLVRSGQQNMLECWVTSPLKEQRLLQPITRCKGGSSQEEMLTLSHLPGKSPRQLCTFKGNSMWHSFWPISGFQGHHVTYRWDCDCWWLQSAHTNRL